jgi:peptidoglycan-N-acetylglucosamine deacetylase
MGAQGLPRAIGYRPVRRLLPGLEGRGRRDHVALTFDDGPDPSSTPALLELLASLGVHATFFVLGVMVRRAGDLTRELVDRGHELALHGWDHGAYFTRGPLRVQRDLARTRSLIQDLGHGRPSFYRPPYGKLTASSLWAARSLGLRTVLWSAWGEDWLETATATSVLEALRPDLDGGGTVLLHDSDCNSAPESWRATLGAVGPLVCELWSQGLSVGPLSEHGLGVGWR